MKITFFAISILVLTLGCTKEHTTTRSYPRVETLPVVDITSAGVTFQGKITYANDDLVEHGFVWSLGWDPTIENSDSVFSELRNGNMLATVTRGLVNGRTYYVRAFARSSDYLVYGNTISFTGSGSLTPYTLTHISPWQHLMPNDFINILGSFDKDIQVKIGGQVVNADRVSGSGGSIKVQLPGLTKDLSSISVITGGHEVISSQKLSMMISYKTNVFPAANAAYNSSNCVVGGKDYFGFGYFVTQNCFPCYDLVDSLFVYDLNLGTSTRLKQKTITPRVSPISFSINGIGYFGGGIGTTGALKDFYSIDSLTNAITKLNDLPSAQTVTGFSINNKGYCITYATTPYLKNELYEFDPVSNVWTKKADYPGAPIKVSSYLTTFFSFVLNGVVYVGGGDINGKDVLQMDRIWSYDPASDIWSLAFIDVAIPLLGNFCALTTNGTAYFMNTELRDGGFHVTQLYEFQPTEKKFKMFRSLAYTFNFNGTFSRGNTGCFFSNASVWEFDPSK